jgi:hypothetical protein
VREGLLWLVCLGAFILALGIGYMFLRLLFPGALVSLHGVNEGSSPVLIILGVAVLGGAVWLVEGLGGLMRRARQLRGTTGAGERETRFNARLQELLDDREHLVTFLRAEAKYDRAILIEELAVEAVALTNSRLLLFIIDSLGLVLVDAVPVGDVAVVEYPRKRRLHRWRAKLRVRSRTLIVKVDSAYSDELALAVSRFPQALQNARAPRVVAEVTDGTAQGNKHKSIFRTG